VISSAITLPAAELTWRFSKSSGPGGQHVNTSDTRVELVWSLQSSTALTATQKAVVAQRLASRINDGTITVVSSAFRSQTRNRADAVERLEKLLADALKPVAKRKPTKPSRGSVQRRLDAKKQRSQIKQGRSSSWD
jgi:ribosome-associated protein